MSVTPIAPTELEQPLILVRTPSPLRAAARRAFRRPLVIISAAWVVILCGATALASVLAPYDPLAQDLNHPLSGPTSAHLLGTDELGRDMLSRLLHGGGSLLVVALVALVAVSTAYLIGVSCGLVVGYRGGRLEVVASFVVNVLFSIPALVIVLAVAVATNNNLLLISLVFGVLLSGGIFRIVQSTTQVARSLLYVDAARVATLPRRRILARHILPNILPPLIVQAFILYSGALIFLASVSFLGLGFSPESPSWGQLIQDATKNIRMAPWLMVATGAPLIATALALNFIGAALLDALPTATRGKLLAPRRRRARGRRAVPATAPYVPVPGGDDAVLIVEDLTVAFPEPDGRLQPVVDGVSLAVRRGETLGLVGESGCGKTMTALGILGLVPPPGVIVGGHVVLDGVDLVAQDERAMTRIRGAKVTFVSQEPMVALDPCMTVGGLLREPIRAHTELDRAATRGRARELLATVGIPRPDAVLRSYAHQLSGGMAQRVAIALALAAEPDVLIADEPTSALDVTVQAEILDLLRSLQARLGMAIVLVTHDFGVIADIATTVAVMYAGQVVETGSVEAMFRRPTHPYTQALLDATPDLLVRDRGLRTVEGAVPSPRDWPHWCRFEPRCPLAVDACRSGPVALATPEPGRASRCVRADELAEAKAR
jgi:peptide/nickel transport system permease protein